MNTGGGTWIMNSEPSKVDEVWLKAQLSLIGNMYEGFMQYICGIELAIRFNRIKIAVWITDADQENIRKIGELIKNFTEASVLEFKKHDSKGFSLTLK